MIIWWVKLTLAIFTTLACVWGINYRKYETGLPVLPAVCATIFFAIFSALLVMEALHDCS